MKNQRLTIFTHLIQTLIACALLLTFAGLASGQEDRERERERDREREREREEQSFQRWTKSEAEKILNNSAWVRTQTLSVAQSGDAQPVDYKFTLLLRSALPVRGALVRLKQIEANYEKMNDAERVNFDASTRGLMQCPSCEEHYVITLSSKADAAPKEDAVFNALAMATLKGLKPHVYIVNERGERREMDIFVPPTESGGEAVFFFPRLDQKGKPLLTRKNKKLTFYLSAQNGLPAMSFDFSVPKIVRDGEVAF